MQRLIARRPTSQRWFTLKLGWSGQHAGMADVSGIPDPLPEMDPNQPVPDDVAELEEPELLPPPPIEATPDDPGGDLGGETAVT